MKINRFVPGAKLFEEIGKNNTEKVKENKSGFSSLLKEKLNDVNDKQISAEKTTEKFIKGEVEDINEVMLSTQEAKMSLELAIQIRNKLVDAYKEINRIQI